MKILEILKTFETRFERIEQKLDKLNIQSPKKVITQSQTDEIFDSPQICSQIADLPLNCENGDEKKKAVIDETESEESSQEEGEIRLAICQEVVEKELQAEEGDKLFKAIKQTCVLPVLKAVKKTSIAAFKPTKNFARPTGLEFSFGKDKCPEIIEID